MAVNRKWVGERYLGARAGASRSAIAILLALLSVSALPMHGQTIITVAGGGPNNSSVDIEPVSVAADASGNLYIADFQRNNVYKVTPAGQLSIVAGKSAHGFSGDGGPATSASLDGPFDVFVDGKGNLFIADYHNHRIREVFGPNPPAGQTAGTIITVAGGGTSPGTCAGSTDPMGDGCAATSASLTSPVGIFVDSKGNLFIADSGNNRIREVVQRKESH